MFMSEFFANCSVMTAEMDAASGRKPSRVFARIGLQAEVAKQEILLLRG